MVDEDYTCLARSWLLVRISWTFWVLYYIVNVDELLGVIKKNRGVPAVFGSWWLHVRTSTRQDLYIL